MNKGLWFQLSRALGGVAVLIALFYLLWGFNYRQTTFQKRLGIDSMEMTKTQMEDEFLQATAALRTAVIALPDEFKNTQYLSHASVSDSDLRPAVKEALRLMQLPAIGRVRIRELWPNGFLMRWSTAGIYIPQTGEGHIDRGLLSVQKPFTIAHEMAHGYGVTDEGACNFIAWLACNQSADPWIRFGGAISYWRFTAAAMPDTTVLHALNSLPNVVHDAIQLVRLNNAKYPDLVPQFRNAIYTSYLKRHGVKSGLKSYHEVVHLVYHYRQTHLVDPVLK